MAIMTAVEAKRSLRDAECPWCGQKTLSFCVELSDDSINNVLQVKCSNCQMRSREFKLDGSDDRLVFPRTKRETELMEEVKQLTEQLHNATDNIFNLERFLKEHREMRQTLDFLVDREKERR